MIGRYWARWLQLDVESLADQTLTHLGAKAFNTPALYQVFQASQLAIVTIAMIALDFDDGSNDRQDMFFGNHPQRLAQGRVRVRFQWGAPESSSDQDIESIDPVRCRRVHQGNQPDIIGLWKCAV